MRHLDVHDDQVGPERAGALHRLATVTYGLDDMLMRAQQVAEQFEIEFVVLDNEHPFCHARDHTFGSYERQVGEARARYK